ncbi:hypothetical protein LWI29_037112 [Acer saccharum]|uniref:Major facilitator superfamily (MFS) profile domain-containing protein n=1 Tax=Acer saccharum TaxID=4024 RepID=A0AA39SIB0_ACESA|nr:hypothetical protein LWI29_037112 [Acer saccharum]
MEWRNCGLWELRPLLHLLLPLCVHWIAQEMPVSVIVDFTTDALCPGQSTCSEAIYISGLQQTIVGVFKMVVIPLLGQLADEYGRKPLLLLTVSANIIPFDVIDESKRAAAFSWITGLLSAAHVLGNVLALVLPEKYVYLVSVILLIFCPAYMQFFLVETVEPAPRSDQESSFLTKVVKILVLPLLNPFVGEKVILCIALLASIAYVSCLILPPTRRKRENLTNFAYSVQALFYGLAWASWVPYLSASFGVIYVLVSPSTYTIISKASSMNNQGKAQGFVAGVESIASFLSPLAMSPLTSWFLSSDAPFNCKGFSIIVSSVCMMISLCFACLLNTEKRSNNDKEEDVETPLLSES